MSYGEKELIFNQARLESNQKYHLSYSNAQVTRIEPVRLDFNVTFHR